MGRNHLRKIPTWSRCATACSYARNRLSMLRFERSASVPPERRRDRTGDRRMASSRVVDSSPERSGLGRLFGPRTTAALGYHRVRHQITRWVLRTPQGLVVVASVLFALAVDRMVSRIDEDALERSYLEGLLEDFGNLEASTAGNMEAAARADTAAVTVLAATTGRVDVGLTGMDLAKALVLSGGVPPLQVTSDTWEDMVNTGSLGILKNAHLRREVALFYRQTDQVRVFNRDWTESARPYGEVVRTILDPELRAAIGMELIYGESISPGLEPDITQLTRRISSSEEIRPAIGDVLLINKVSARLYAHLNERAQTILRMINDNLDAF